MPALLYWLVSKKRLCVHLLNKVRSTLFYKIKIAHSPCFHLKLWSGAESGRRTKSPPWFRGAESREDITFLVEAFICSAVIGLMTESSTINMICNALGAWGWSLFPPGQLIGAVYLRSGRQSSESWIYRSWWWAQFCLLVFYPAESGH